MTVTVLNKPLCGTIAAPSSKSDLHRKLICASLSDSPCSIAYHGELGHDILATIDCLRALGAQFTIHNSQFTIEIKPIINKLDLPKNSILDCNESGSTLRFMLPIVCALGIRGSFQMAGRLPERPLAPFDAELAGHGITFSRPELNILYCEGRLEPGEYVLPGNVSSQYITGLLLALPLIAGDSCLTVTEPIESEDYITLTLDVCAAFGRKHSGVQYIFRKNEGFKSPGVVDAEGDWSNAAFWLCAGAMPGGDITLNGMHANSTQGDKEICNILRQMGAQAEWLPDGTVSVKEGKRRGVDIDARAIPDLVPVLAAVAAVSEGTTFIKNAGRLRIKESDRLMSTTQTLNALGAKVMEAEDGLRIEGVPTLSGGTVDAHGDHRIAMMAAIATAACSGNVTITGATAVNKSYPKFWEDLARLGKEVTM